ncbi:MAG: hypothetical protein Q9209_001501 [Squamulea sp. 1 TL-2023]
MGGSSTSFIRKWWQSPPAYLKIRFSKWTIGITAFGACFTDGFLYGSIVPVLPFSLVDRSGVSEDDATLLFCFATKPWVLVLERVFQGLSASVIYTAGLALIADAVDPKEIGAWMGFVFSGNTLGLLFSPFLAGIVYDYLGYYSVFIVLFGVIVVDVALRGFMIEKRTADKWLEKETNTQGNSSREENEDSCARNDQEPIAAEDEGATLQSPPADERSSLLHSKSKRSRSWIGRLFPTLAVLASSPRLLIAIYGCFTHTMLLACIDSILPLFVKRTFEWSSTGAGVIFLTITCPSLFGAFFGASYRLGEYDDKPGIDGSSRTQRLARQGIGLNLIFPSLAADLFYEVDVLAETHSETFGTGGAYAQAYSLLCAALGAGTAFGPIWAGVFYQKTNWPITMATLAGLTALPAVGVIRYTGGAVNEEKYGRVEAPESRV